MLLVTWMAEQRIFVTCLRYVVTFVIASLIAIVGVYPVFAARVDEVTLSVDRETVKAGESIFIVVSFTNMTAEPQRDFRRWESLWRRDVFTVTKAGRKLTRKEEKFAPNEIPRGSPHSSTLMPGESATYTDGEISRWYDMTRPGTYEIQMRWHGRQSNRLFITVVP